MGGSVCLEEAEIILLTFLSISAAMYGIDTHLSINFNILNYNCHRKIGL